MRELRAPLARFERDTRAKRKGVGRPLPPPHHPSP
ncbi:hypothetical protein FHS29_003186 [Saccharothrix tamanrassetensis]|uniref:Uncharacterized protein n=1 Tax=Saccharothrix tamanrassetensis TaxID=1051531 RepID=A0A841CHX5_9PSEU|nr:hypothetical protein [Saccharothrix tamanrassetensis]